MRSRGARTVHAISAGGVVHRAGTRGPEVVLVQTPARRWGLPKGTPDEGEHLEETALREVREETGLDVTLGDKVGAIEYWFTHPETRERIHKAVHFWLMEPLGGDIRHHDHEHVAVRWFPLGEAVRTVSYKNTVSILERAAALLSDGADGAPKASRMGGSS